MLANDLTADKYETLRNLFNVLVCYDKLLDPDEQSEKLCKSTRIAMDALCATLTDEQNDLFDTYMNVAVEEFNYQGERSFIEAFRLATKLLTESMR